MMVQTTIRLAKADIKKAVAFWVSSGMPDVSTKGVSISAGYDQGDPGHYSAGGGSFVNAIVEVDKETG